MATKKTRKTAKAPSTAPEIDVAASEPGLFSTAVVATTGAGVEVGKWDVDLLAAERTMSYPHLSPSAYLREIKGLTEGQIDYVFKRKPAHEWDQARDRVWDRVTETMIKRHTDLIAEAQDTHVRASKLGMAKAIEMLAKLPVLTEDEYEIEDPATGKKKLIKKRTLRSVDLMNCMTAIKTAQEVYRRAMGLPNDQEGLSQVLERLKIENSNVQINMGGGAQEAPRSAADELLSQLSYDQVAALIEMKRANEASEVKEADDSETKNESGG